MCYAVFIPTFSINDILFFLVLFFSAVLIQSVVFLPVSISPLLLSVMKVKDGLVLLANSAVCLMNESCPPRESEGTVVYMAGID